MTRDRDELGNPFSEMPIWARMVFASRIESVHYWDMHLDQPPRMMTIRNDLIEFEDSVPDFDPKFFSKRDIQDVTVIGWKWMESIHRSGILVYFTMEWIDNGVLKPYRYCFLVQKDDYPFVPRAVNLV